MKYQSNCLCSHFFELMNCTLNPTHVRNMQFHLVSCREINYRFCLWRNSQIFLKSTQTITWRAILRHSDRIGGLSNIRLHTALKPWVIRSVTGDSSPSLVSGSGLHNAWSRSNAAKGKSGASESNLPKDLSDGGSVSLKPSACKKGNTLSVAKNKSL